jgi:lipopolysaccharide transport system permease protein
MSETEISKSVTAAADTWDIVIKSTSATKIDLAVIWRHRELVWMFFKRDFTTFYKQTVLGPIWYLIQPLLTAFTYFVVFGKIANLSTDGLPPIVFYMSGTIIWNYFSTCLINNSETFSKNANLFSKVYFPRLVVPVAVAMSGLVAFTIQFSLLTVIAVGLWLSGGAIDLSWQVLIATPLVLLSIATLGIGAGLVVSAMTVRYRDLVYAVGFMAQLWMYATPIVYSFSQVPDRYQWLYYLNPMTAPVQMFRSAFFNAPTVPLSLCIANSAIILLVLFIGLLLFSRAEANAMDTV